MSNHFSAAMLKFPGGDARLDLTDLFVFASPQSPDKTVLILDVNPFMTGADFHPDAVYRLNVDNDADLQVDAAFSFVFSESNGDSQTGTVYYATGSQAREPEPGGEVLFDGIPVSFDEMATPVEAGPCRLFIGVRSDPFFADGEGAFHDFQFTGDDTFAGKKSSAWRWKCRTTRSAPVRRSPPGRQRAYDETAPSYRSIGSGTRLSTRSSSTSSRTGSTRDSRPMTWRTTWSPGRSYWRVAAMRPPRPETPSSPCFPTSFTTIATSRRTTPTAEL